jgi:hypothetical protein
MYEERERERKRLRERERERERVSGDTVVAKMHVAQSRVKWWFFLQRGRTWSRSYFLNLLFFLRLFFNF